MVEAEGPMNEEPLREEPRGEEKSREFTLRFRMPRLFPEETKHHMRAAQKEMLLAVRSMLDSCIESLEERDQNKGTRTTRIDIT